MDVDGDRFFSSGDLEKLENADEVSTNHREGLISWESVCLGEKLKVNGRYYLIGTRNMNFGYKIG